MAHSKDMNNITDIQHTTGNGSKRVTFTLDGIDCEMVRYQWDGPTYAFADRDNDGIREMVIIKSPPVRDAFQLAWTYTTDEALQIAMRNANAVLGAAMLQAAAHS